ncbi:MAG TPA: tetratricopeptide repeat protein [Methylomirabilota bacterium]|nr:tetratricopeptide repeat protein [Methylomirabilota bacterium]
MRRKDNLGLRGMLLFAALLLALAPRAAAQFNGSVRGQIRDIDGKPWAGIVVELISDQGLKIFSTKTDNKGNYVFGIVKPGNYKVAVELPPPNQIYRGDVFQVDPAKGDSVQDFNFKDILAKQSKSDPGRAEAIKKQEEEKQKIEGVKGHFNAGRGYLDQETAAKTELTAKMRERVPDDQKDAHQQAVDALKQKVADLSNQAVGEFQQASKLAGEKDSNQHIFWASMGTAYDLAGRDDDAINAYKQAIAAKGNSPEAASYYNNMGNVYARSGKVDEAREAYVKSAELNPANAANAWRNFGITLYNAGRLKEAVEPLKKATELDPKSAQAWYLLGASLVGSIDSTKDCKVTADKMDCKIPEGTVAAYEKAVELDPNGPYGAQAKMGLEGLQAMSSGISTKYGGAKKKKS